MLCALPVAEDMIKPEWFLNGYQTFIEQLLDFKETLQKENEQLE